MKIVGVANPEWQELSACRTEDPALFFASNKEYVDKAKAVCSRCQVRTKCLVWGLKIEKGDAGFREGVLAGLTPQERARIKLCSYSDCVKVKPKKKQGSYWFCSDEHRTAYQRETKEAYERRQLLEKHEMQEYHQRGTVTGYA